MLKYSCFTNQEGGIFMIKLTLGRTKTNDVCPTQVREETPANALKFLLESELAFGTQIVTLEPTKIELVTHVMHCIDTSLIEGPAEEMKPLYETCQYYLAACHFDEISQENVFNTLSTINNGQGILPLHLVMAGGMLLGDSRLRVAFLLGLGMREEAEIKQLATYPLKDLVAAYQLQQETPGKSLAELLT